MTVFLVEGVDRAGKTTRCRELMKETRDRLRLMVHFVAPPKDDSLVVLKEIETVLQLQHEHPELDVVLDRGWVSWFVYEGLYRDPAKGSLRAMYAWENMMRFLYPSVQVKLVLVEAHPDVLVDRDDGFSTWSRGDGAQSKFAATKELLLFQSYAVHSRLCADKEMVA